jgi:two-component system sensor histidine kinase KdpD
MARIGDKAGYAWALGSIAVCTLVAYAMRPRFDLVNVAMVYLMPVIYVALRHSRGAAIATAVLAVLAFDVLFVPPEGTLTVDDAQYLLTFAIMLAVALIISRLTEDNRRGARQQAALEVEAESERMRSALLASISHDLRTPLAVMSGASSSLAEQGEQLPAEERRALARSVFEHSREMADRVAKILQMTRLESGPPRIEREWASIAEIAGAVLERLEARLANHRVMVEIPPDLPLVRVDAPLIEQALGNLLENAALHTPPGTVVRLMAKLVGDEVVVSVEDYGGGLAAGDVERVFDKFHRGRVEGGSAGMGLGLAICRAIVRLHGGRAWAESLGPGGTVFRFSLPFEQAPVVPEEAAS